MVDVEDAVIARLKIGNELFEILVDCDKAVSFKEGKCSVDDALATDRIFKDVRKGLHTSEHELEKVFGTSDARKVAEEILRKGEVQLTSEYRNRLRVEKRKAIINLIHRNCINPQTGLPHPPDRIDRAIDQARISIHEFKKPEDQIHEVIEAIRPIIPIAMESRELEIRVPAKYASQSYGTLKRFGTMLKDDWRNDGSLLSVIEIPSGLHEDLETELNKITHGEVEIRILTKK